MNNILNPIRGAFNNEEFNDYTKVSPSLIEISQLIGYRSIRNKAFVGSKLVAMQTRRRINQRLMNIAIERVSSFMDAMAIDFANDNQMVSFDDFMNDSITIKFRQQKDLKISISLEEDLEDASDETLVVYDKNGITYMQNDSLSNSVLLIKHLLDL